MSELPEQVNDRDHGLQNEKTDAISCSHVTFRYLQQNKANVLKDISVSFPKGEVTVLMGRSGCGKSTLAALMGGLYPENGGILQSGKILLMRKDLSSYSIPERSKVLSMMFQNADLQFCMQTLRQEMTFCLENISCPPSDMGHRIQEAAEKTGMTDYLDRPFLTLSGGEKQKAALSCIFLLQQEGGGEGVILLDEPFANIDIDWAEKIADQLIEMNKQLGTTIIAVDHSLDVWLSRADRIMIMNGEGKICASLLPDQVRKSEDLFKAEGLRWPYQTVLSKQERTKICSNGPAVGTLTDHLPDPENSEEKVSPTIALQDAGIYAGKKHLGSGAKGTLILGHADAAFYPGEMTAVLGPSGAGKTTLFRTLLGRQNYTGNICIRDDSTGQMQELRQMKTRTLLKNVGIVFQNPSNQFITQNVLQEVETGILGRPVKPEKLAGSDTENAAIAMLREFGLSRFRRYSPYMLSQGQQRRLAVLSVIAGQQKVLLLDEPTYGQDEAMTEEIMKILEKRMEQEKLTILFSTHDPVLVKRWADKVYRIEDGELR